MILKLEKPTTLTNFMYNNNGFANITYEMSSSVKIASIGLLFMPGVGHEFLQTNWNISRTLSVPLCGSDKGIATLKR